MCQVPTSLAGLLSLLAPCFTQPSFQTFSMLVVGFVGRVRDCTVTGMLQAAGVAGCWHHSRAHDFFARRRWDPDRLGLALLDFLVEVFVKVGAPIRLAVDDTLFGRSGRRVWGAHYLHDGAQPEGSGRRTRWGNCWVVVVLVVQLEPGTCSRRAKVTGGPCLGVNGDGEAAFRVVAAVLGASAEASWAARARLRAAVIAAVAGSAG